MIKQLFKHPSIQVALAAGLCIIIQAYFYKKVLHLGLNTALVAIPAFIFTVHGALTSGKNSKIDKRYTRTIYWILAIILATIISILVPVLDNN